MQNIKNIIKGAAFSVAESISKVSTESKFRETGMITPEEFIAAGDHLVHHCPSWEWATGDESRIRNFLPREKQFLITRKVACTQRCKQMEYTGEEAVVEEDLGGGWVETHRSTAELSDKVSDMTLDNSKFDDDKDNEVGDMDNYNANNAADDDDDEDGGFDDMEEFESSGKLEQVDLATATIARKPPPKINDSEANSSANNDDSLIKTRTYDLHITYDKLYQTPRLWMIGYDENRKLLTVEQMYEDVSQDHAKKTVTMESHPHLPGPNMGSVHPCKHADIMKKIIQTVEEGGGELGVHMYLIIFLKFVQTVIPTIEYDFTMNFSL